MSGNGDQGADPNQLVAITDNLSNTTAASAANEKFSTVRSAGFGEVLRGGLITYTEYTKVVLAGVAPQILDEVGPVAGPTARALAVGARQRCEATWGVGLTGVAGPEPHGGHEVGTVFMGLAGPDDHSVTEVVELQFSGTRWDIRIAAVRESISRLRALVAAA